MKLFNFSFRRLIRVLFLCGLISVFCLWLRPKLVDEDLCFGPIVTDGRCGFDSNFRDKLLGSSDSLEFPEDLDLEIRNHMKDPTLAEAIFIISILHDRYRSGAKIPDDLRDRKVLLDLFANGLKHDFLCMVSSYEKYDSYTQGVLLDDYSYLKRDSSSLGGRMLYVFFRFTEMFAFVKNKTLNGIYHDIEKLRCDGSKIQVKYEFREFSWSNFFGDVVTLSMITNTSPVLRKIDELSADKLNQDAFDGAGVNAEHKTSVQGNQSLGAE